MNNNDDADDDDDEPNCTLWQTKYSARATMGMLPGFLSIFYKDKEDSQDVDELHKHRKQSSLTLQQQSFNNSFQQQQQQFPQQAISQQQSNLMMQHIAQQSNKISTSNSSEQQQQPTVNNNHNNESYNIHKQTLSSEAEERLCNFLNSVHNLSVGGAKNIFVKYNYIN